MRVRIIKTTLGVVDGVSLRSFVAGCVYDITPSVARYLVTNGFAEDVPQSDGDHEVPQDTPYAVEQMTKGVTVVPPGEIHLLEKRRRRRDRRKTRRLPERRQP
jgi:hypothetical protein